MKPNVVIGVALLAAAAFFGLRGRIELPFLPDAGPDVPAVVVNVPDALKTELRSAFTDKPDAAQVWAGIFGGMARFVEADGKTSKPLVRTVFDLQQLRDAVVAAPPKAVDGGPLVAKAVAPYMDAIGKDGEALDDAKRKQVVELYTGVAEVLGGL